MLAKKLEFNSNKIIISAAVKPNIYHAKLFFSEWIFGYQPDILTGQFNELHG